MGTSGGEVKSFPKSAISRDFPYLTDDGQLTSFKKLLLLFL